MEIIKLNLIPSGVNPVCHVKQYDEGRVIRIDLFDGLTPYVLKSGDTVSLNVRKPDNTIIDTTITATQGNTYVNIETTEQMCAVVGYNLCTLKITNGSVDIGTLDFIMQVARDVLADGIPSQSVIEDLDALVQEAVGEQYYTKSETDALLDDKADKATTYTKTEVDTIANTKANASALQTLAGTTEQSFNAIREIVQSTNYASLSANDVIIPSGKDVTVTDGESGTVYVKNNSGVNVNIKFPLPDLPYDTRIDIDFTITASDAANNTGFALVYGPNSYIQKTFVDNGDGTWSTSMNMISYSHALNGDLSLNVNTRFNQTINMSVSLKAIEQGATEETLIKNNTIKNLELNNLSDNLKNIIINGSDYPTLYGGKEICVFNKGLAIGDSLTAGVFNTHDGYITNAAYSYPAKLKQISGVDMTNLGNGGKTSVQWYTDHENDDLSGYQFAIIQLGVNDAGVYHEWSQESETAFTNIINKLLNENNGIFVFVSTIIPAISYSGEYYDSVSEGIRDLVETLNNDHVILLDMAEYGNTGDEAGYNNGHLSALGYERLALDYISYISYVISQNLTLFRNVQFIGTNNVYP